MSARYSLRGFISIMLLLVLISIAYGAEHLDVTIGDRVIHSVPKDFLSFNIDSASLCNGHGYDRVDFTNPVLRELTKHLQPSILRIGGSTADSVIWSDNGDESTPKGFSGVITPAYWDTIASFADETNTPLIWDFDHSTMRDENGDWDPSNAAQHLAYLDRDPDLRKRIIKGFQLSNEPGHWILRKPTPFTVGELIEAFHKLKSMLPEDELLLGPDVCGPLSSKCSNQTFLGDFLKGTTDILDGVTIHFYPLSPHVELSGLTDPIQLARTDLILSLWDDVVEESNPNVMKIIGETATCPDGGCVGYSNTYASGFFWIDVLGRAATMGYSHVFRQDLIGWSGTSTKSSYALLGGPGWTTGTDLLPNPDYYTSILWKKIMGDRFLSSSTFEHNYASLKLYATCNDANELAIAFVNMGNSTTEIELSLKGDVSFADVKHEYHLVSSEHPKMDSQFMLLNDQMLLAEHAHALMDMHVTTSTIKKSMANTETNTPRS